MLSGCKRCATFDPWIRYKPVLSSGFNINSALFANAAAAWTQTLSVASTLAQVQAMAPDTFTELSLEAATQLKQDVAFSLMSRPQGNALSRLFQQATVAEVPLMLATLDQSSFAKEIGNTLQQRDRQNGDPIQSIVASLRLFIGQSYRTALPDPVSDIRESLKTSLRLPPLSEVDARTVGRLKAVFVHARLRDIHQYLNNSALINEQTLAYNAKNIPVLLGILATVDQYLAELQDVDLSGFDYDSAREHSQMLRYGLELKQNFSLNHESNAAISAELAKILTSSLEAFRTPV